MPAVQNDSHPIMRILLYIYSIAGQFCVCWLWTLVVFRHLKNVDQWLIWLKFTLTTKKKVDNDFQWLWTHSGQFGNTSQKESVYVSLCLCVFLIVFFSLVCVSDFHSFYPKRRRERVRQRVMLKKKELIWTWCHKERNVFSQALSTAGGFSIEIRMCVVLSTTPKNDIERMWCQHFALTFLFRPDRSSRLHKWNHNTQNNRSPNQNIFAEEIR